MVASSFRKLTNSYRNFTFIRTYFIVVLQQHNKLVERQQQHSIVVIQQQQREWVWETRPTLFFLIFLIQQHPLFIHIDKIEEKTAVLTYSNFNLQYGWPLWALFFHHSWICM